MYTQCPECATVFRVTAAVLRAAHGQVRCGVCDANFDALRFLSDDVDLEVNAASASRIVGESTEARPGPAPPAASGAPRAFGAATRNRPSADEQRELGQIAALLARGVRPQPAPEPAPQPVRAPEPRPAAPPAAVEINVLEPTDVEDIILGDEGGGHIPDAALEFDLPADSWEQVFVTDAATAQHTPLDLELESPAPAAGVSRAAPEELSLVEERDDPLARTDEYEAQEIAAEFDLAAMPGGAAAELAPAQLTEFEPTDVAEFDRAPPPREPPGTAAAARTWRPLDEPLGEPAAAAGAGAPRAARGRGAGLAAAVVLALGLVAQGVHQFRDALAESPLVGPALAALYARLGLALEPRWDLTAFDVRQWGAQSEETAGVLRLRASIVNRAARAQPYPLLRVTLEDRFGARVGRREFAPLEYLPGRAAPRELLAPGARADADLKLADPGNQAVGFELDVCLLRHGALQCGADAKAGGS